MDLTEGITRRAARAAQMLAFLAAFFLAFNMHPLHAQSDMGAAHGHFGSLCEIPDDGDAAHGGEDSSNFSYSDCIHHCDSMVQAHFEQGRLYLAAATAALHSAPNREPIFTFDPRPPRQ